MNLALASSPNIRALGTKLVKSQFWKEYQYAFTNATGLPLGFVSAGSENSTQGRFRLRNENRFCKILCRTAPNCKICHCMQRKLQADAELKPASNMCSAGFTNTAVPVRAGNTLLGHLVTGQVFLAPKDETNFAVVGDVFEVKNLESDKLREAYFSTRVVTPEKYTSMVRLLILFSQHLSSLSNRLMVQIENSESPSIQQAKQFISNNLDKDFDLPTVAAHVNMSPFYFCRTFKRYAGTTFTDYVSRLRVEKAKEQLLNPHVRTSEVAYAVGFQSLSQFYRAFRRVTGQSPVEYRKDLITSN